MPPRPSTARVAPVPRRSNQGATQDQRLKPVYPAIARSAHVAGVVTIDATIDPTGKFIDAKVVRSIPLSIKLRLTPCCRGYPPTL